MAKPLLSLAVSGIVLLLIWKVLAVLLLPLLAGLLGALVIVLKVVSFATALLIALWIFRQWAGRENSAG